MKIVLTNNNIQSISNGYKLENIDLERKLLINEANKLIEAAQIKKDDDYKKSVSKSRILKKDN